MQIMIALTVVVQTPYICLGHRSIHIAHNNPIVDIIEINFGFQLNLSTFKLDLVWPVTKMEAIDN